MTIKRRAKEKIRWNGQGSSATCHAICYWLWCWQATLSFITYIPWRQRIWRNSWKTMQASLKGLERTDEREAFSGGVDCVLDVMLKGMNLTREGRRECDWQWNWHSPLRLGKEVVVGMEGKRTGRRVILHWWSPAWRWMIACRWSYHGYQPIRYSDCSLHIQSYYSIPMYPENHKCT